MLRKTALHQNHIKHNAKMGEFAGYDMPLYYSDGVIKEHVWVRSHAGLFDVSHMGQAMVKGPGAREFVKKLTPSGFDKLRPGRTRYTVLTNKDGGIIDDLMVTCAEEDAYHFVLNAGCKDKDMAWMKQHLPDGLEFTYFDDWALIALQGPSAESVLREALNIDASDMNYMDMRPLNDGAMFISRLGYTGEDGFEISVPNADASSLWEKILAHEEVKPAGLAARDSLRLEMGYALYGHDINEDTSPVEAGLGWVIGKNREGYFGAKRIYKEVQEGTARQMSGIQLTEKGVAREGARILSKDGEEIGVLTSGGFSPTLQKSIGQGYVQCAYTEPGTEILVEVRSRRLSAEIVALPHIQPRTKTAKRKAA